MSFAKAELFVAQINWQPLWEDHGIPLAIMGLVVVFAALTLLRVFIGSLPRIMAILDHYFPEEAEAVPQAKPVAQPPASGIPEEIVVVIAAAVAATISEPHRIVRTRALSPEDLSWSLEGRLQHHASHSIYPRNPY